ncbi:SPFH domain-containing protein [Mycoplasma sp. 744]|uniref:SPFH domain-containing protein n=1 Tax=unclassified Mycoplasma TaxID=2683645 RepID=UPI00211CAAAA|nr:MULTISPECIES: SPFH domain-containing protein [unclassified Mycoplasma]MEA4115621.1 SPFH domain-containing protein [Mycoplasma sp. 744]UUM19167.1 SPFH/Band 7/PHB domain protein [Mycoplasma sp. 1018B]
MNIAAILIPILILLLLITFLALSIVIVRETNFLVIERLGKYNRTLKNGIHFKWPFIEKVVLKENFKEKVFDFPAQLVITKDNVTMLIDTVVFLKIMDAKLFAYGAEKPILAIENLTATTLRNLIGELELDESLTSRETVNGKLTSILEKESDAWGIHVKRVEIQNIKPPTEVQEAMIRQMRAEREKRAAILEAEGLKHSEILKAEAIKEKMILEAQGEKENQILLAQAQKEKEILFAQGQKQALELLNSVEINPAILQLKSIEQLSTLANGNATKIILPPNLGEITKIIATGSELIESKK